MARVVIAGGGPAGIMAAVRSAYLGNNVTLIEKNASLGKKLLLSGKGRCNLTNTCGLDDFLRRFSASGNFLRDAFKLFFNKELTSFFEKRGVKLKAERQGRVFPVSDSSVTILNALKKELTASNVRVIFGARLIGVDVENFSVKSALLSNKGRLAAEKIILACGGAAYPFTGSDGNGYDIAKELGHTITDIKPGLVPLKVKQKHLASRLKGLTLKNIQLKFSSGRKKVKSDIGELLFTDSGISGPLVLTLSGRLLDILKARKGLIVEIDLKPALSREMLDVRLQREFNLSPKRSLGNMLKAMLPHKLISVFLDTAGIDKDKKVAHVTRRERAAIETLLKSMRLEITGSLGMDKAMITRGGISLKEIDPRTMASKLIKGLYFAGEIMDIDADTGGFNLQAAFSTGYVAGS